MKFNPFGNEYDFTQKTLIRSFPDYFIDPLDTWLWKVLYSVNVVKVHDGYYSAGDKRYLTTEFINETQIFLRELVPHHWNEFVKYAFSNEDRAANIIALCLQNFVDADDVVKLEIILSQGGSGYTVLKVDKNARDYEKGVYDLVDRVSEVVMQQSKTAISNNELLMRAWTYCYSRNPDYEKTVIDSQNFLEYFLRDIYEPKTSKPQLGKLIGNLKSSPSKLKFKGDNVIGDKKSILDLITNVANFRGMHTAGTGKNPTKVEAEYILHSTIYIWNLHQK